MILKAFRLLLGKEGSFLIPAPRPKGNCKTCGWGKEFLSGMVLCCGQCQWEDPSRYPGDRKEEVMEPKNDRCGAMRPGSDGCYDRCSLSVGHPGDHVFLGMSFEERYGVKVDLGPKASFPGDPMTGGELAAVMAAERDLNERFERVHQEIGRLQARLEALEKKP